MIRVLLFLSTILLSCAPHVEREADRWARQAAAIEIIRDDFGVPHIYGKTDADAVFGLLYAQCEDDFNRVEQNYIWATGRLAEVDGEESIYSDVRARMFMTQDEAIQYYENSPAWLKKLCDAFADGINYYLYTHPEVKPKLLTHFEPWMPMYFSEGSIGGDIENISTDKIKEFYQSDSVLASTDGVEGIPVLESEPDGSNGFAISGALTESGKAMLLINPHTSFFFRGEFHMISDEGLNAYGAVTWGQFFIYQGFNEKAGWMHTSTYTDRIDEFIETTIHHDGNIYYKYGDTIRQVETRKVTLRYSVAGEFRDRQFSIYRTHHGPVTHRVGEKWVTTSMLWKPARALEQSFVRMKARNLDAFGKMMDLRTNATNNTVYADADGSIAYYHGNFIPVKDNQIDYTQPVDGSDPATDWRGAHAIDDIITVFNPPNGWIQNCNSTPFTSAGKFSPVRGAYPRYMTRDVENYRGVHAVRLLENVKSLTLDRLITLAYDPYLPAFEVLVPGLIQAFDSSPYTDPDVVKAIQTLRHWDFRVRSESVAMTLAHFYGIHCLQKANLPDELNFMERIEFVSVNTPVTERIALFSEALKKLSTDFGSWEIPWGEINRYQRINGDIIQPFNDSLPSIPIGLASGRWGALASFGASATPQTKRIYGTSGNSFVAVVEFGDSVKAKSMLAGGQSGNPHSPHFNDQAQRYADIQFKDVAFYRSDVVNRSEESYHPGAR
jgi:acyl-homoserine lactone acylase PvdQ